MSRPITRYRTFAEEEASYRRWYAARMRERLVAEQGATATAEVTVRNCTINYGTLVPSPLSEYGMLLVDAPGDCNKLAEEPDQ